MALVVALVPAAAWGGERASAGRTADKATAAKADLDGDKVFDDLEAVLEPLSPQDTVAVIVTLTGAATKSRVDRVRAEEGDFDEGQRFEIIPAFSATMRKTQVLKAARRSDVVHVEHDSEVRATNESAQASFGVAAAQAQVTSLTGAGLAVAVIDTGIDPNHPDLAGRVVAFKDYVNPSRTTAYDDHGHGTHVAGTIAATPTSAHSGAAPAANLVGVKVLDSLGSGSMANVTAGIDWVVANASTHNTVAINLSLGTSGCSNGTDATSQAVNNAAAAGIVVAVAAGNAGSGTCTVASPGAAAGALTVGAMTDFQQGGFHQAYFSSRGPTLDGRIKPDISAPGVNITSAQANTLGYATMSGTSMATPFVAAVALLMRQAGAAPADVKTKIINTARDWGTAGADKDYGAGRLDAYAALAAAGAQLTLPPAMPAHDVLTGNLSGTGAVRDYPLAITDTSFPVAATLIHSSVSGSTSANPDFDLYLLAPNGAELDRGYTSRRQEDVGAAPTTTGTYTVRVKSFNGSGPYLLDLSAGTATAPDTVAPTVTSVSPADGATADPGANVSVTFSEPMDQAATQAAFSIAPSVGGAFTWSASTLTFNPTADLTAATTYTATIGTGAKDLAGQALASATTWSFAITTTVSGTATPASATVVTGAGSSSVSTLSADDNSFYTVNSSSKKTVWEAVIQLPSGKTFTALNLTYRGKNSRTCSQTLSVLRSGSFAILATRSVGTSEATVATALASGGDVAVDGKVKVRVSCSTSQNFKAQGDLLRAAYEYSA